MVRRRSAGGAYFFSPDRQGKHPQAHLARFEDVLQAEAYAGFRSLYEADAARRRRVREAAFWAHLRRDFHDVWKATGSEIAREALERIRVLYDIELEINGTPAQHRLEVRTRESRPRVGASGPGPPASWTPATTYRIGPRFDSLARRIGRCACGRRDSSGFRSIWSS